MKNSNECLKVDFSKTKSAEVFILHAQVAMIIWEAIPVFGNAEEHLDSAASTSCFYRHDFCLFLHDCMEPAILLYTYKQRANKTKV